MNPLVAFGSKLGLQTDVFPRRALPILGRLKQLGVTVPVFKSINNGGAVMDAKHASPGTLTVLRLAVDDFNNDYQVIAGTSDASMLTLARRHLDKVQATWNAQELAAADVVELVNEVDPPQVHGWQRLFTFLAYLCEEATRRKIKIATPGCAYGTPEYSEWEEVVLNTLFFQKALAGGHWLSLHEGVLPGSDDPIVFGGIPGAPATPGAGPTCFRYRFLYENLLKPRRMVVPLLISELVLAGGYQVSNFDRIWSQMVQYDRELRRDYYVVGATPFILTYPGGSWDSQDYSPVWDDPRADAYYLAERDRANAVADSPTTPPPLGYTHLVYNCAALNVRSHPWAGRIAPPLVRTLQFGQPVTVYGVYRDHDMRWGWACINDDGGEWVSSYYLKAAV